jgi:hypothetical protein
MGRLYAVGAFGLLLSVATGALLYFHFGELNNSSSGAEIAGEAFKILLTFTFVALGGALIKGAVDSSLDQQRAQRSRTEQNEERQTAIIKEFVNIFSEFYSIRKLYHSARTHPHIYDLQSDEYARLVKDILKKSVELEGRYGALKILVINHFALPDENYTTKSRAELQRRIDQIKDRPIQERIPESMRLRLDLLGELYDDWRHALERECSISVGAQVWEIYEALLRSLMKAHPSGQPIGGTGPNDLSRRVQTFVRRLAYPSVKIPRAAN